MTITSKQNSTVKKIASLKQKKYRKEYGLYIAEGEKTVKEAKRFGLKPEYLVVTETQTEQFNGFFDCEMLTVSNGVFEYLSDEVTPQGVLVVLQVPENTLKLTKTNCLLLDGIKDSGNLGTILRTAAATDVTDVIVVDCADAFSPKTVRASMSGIFLCNIIETDRKTALRLVLGRQLIVADMFGESVFDYKESKPFCLVVGSEADGVSTEIKEKAGKTLMIPMKNGIESLNAGVSLSVILYNLFFNK